jgi:hypothetical protein
MENQRKDEPLPTTSMSQQTMQESLSSVGAYIQAMPGQLCRTASVAAIGSPIEMDGVGSDIDPGVAGGHCSTGFGALEAKRILDNRELLKSHQGVHYVRNRHVTLCPGYRFDNSKLRYNVRRFRPVGFETAVVRSTRARAGARSRRAETTWS